MEYTMTTPCDACPFLVKMKRGFALSRLKEMASGSFHCHKTGAQDEETGDYVATEKSLACAGALIFNEKRNQPNQMMRICERLGMYDRRKLDMIGVSMSELKAVLLSELDIAVVRSLVNDRRVMWLADVRTEQRDYHVKEYQRILDELERTPHVLAALVAKWKESAADAREEAGRIRRTIKDATDAEMRCNVRAEVWDKCAGELESALGGK